MNIEVTYRSYEIPWSKFALFILLILIGPITCTIAIALMDRTQGYSPTVACGVGGGSLALIGLWTALGTGSFWKRLAVTSIILVIYSLSILLGFVYLIVYDGGAFWMNEPSYAYLTQIVLTAAIVLGTFSQIPFWFVRILLGWRICDADSHDTAPPNLKEMFAILAMFAIAFATPQMAEQAYETFLASTIVPGEMAYELKTENDAMYYTQVAVTEENADRILEGQLQGNAGFGVYFYVYGGFVSGLALFSLPFVWFVLRSKTVLGAVGKSTIFILCPATLIVAVAWILNGFRFSWQLSWPYLLLIAIWSLTIVVPLLLMRRIGFRLSIHSSSKAQLNSPSVSNAS